MDADQQDGASQEGQRGTGDVYRREADDVDLVDFHSMSSGFARAVFEDVVVILGDADRLEALAARYGGDLPSVTDARERITAAGARLGEEST
jgi:hypothetical protein